jgi:hypothetical protein
MAVRLAFGGDRLARLQLSVEAQVERLEVVDTGRSRRLSAASPLRTTESLSGPRQVSATARRHGIFAVAVVYVAPRLSPEHGLSLLKRGLCRQWSCPTFDLRCRRRRGALRSCW